MASDAKTSVSANWMAEVQAAVAAGLVCLRQMNVDYSTTGQGAITGL